MSNRAATILAVAAVISSFCLYATSAQVELTENPTSGAIVVGPPPIRLQQELPGRYQVGAVSSGAGRWEFVVIDTHSGQCWLRNSQIGKWQDLGSPVEKDEN